MVPDLVSAGDGLQLSIKQTNHFASFETGVEPCIILLKEDLKHSRLGQTFAITSSPTIFTVLR